MFCLFYMIPRARLRCWFEFRRKWYFFGWFFWMVIFDIRQLQKEEHLRISLRKIITFHLKRRPSPFHILKWATNKVKFCVKSFCHWLCLNSGGVTPGKSNVVYKWSGSVAFRTDKKYIVRTFWKPKENIYQLVRRPCYKNGMLIWIQKGKELFFLKPKENTHNEDQY